MTSRQGGALLVLALIACSVSGCSYGGNNVSCPSWAGFPSPQDKYDAADLVVVTSSSVRNGTAPIFGVDAHSYDVAVAEVVKGDVGTDGLRAW